MAAGIIYLDVDDEITSAAARIRDTESRRVAIVLPYGSRVATSRINFRLLARDAMSHEKRLSIVAGDPATRALAASAGLPVFATVSEYESSAEAPKPSDASAPADDGGRAGTAAAAAIGGAAAAAVGAGAAATDAPDLSASATVVTGDDSPRSGSAATSAAAETGATTIGHPVPPPRTTPRTPSSVPAADLPPEALGAGSGGAVVAGGLPRAERVSRSSGRGIPRTPLLLGLAVIGLVAIVAAVGAYLFLPSATVAITPREESIGPVSFQVTASTTATEPDPEAGVVPAQLVEEDVGASETYPATGKRVEEERATGEVQFENLDPTSSNTIAKGAVVSTEGGIRFRTDRRITVPSATLAGLTIIPAKATVDVTAVDAGPDGNVPAGAITVEPRGENNLFLSVSNPEPTGGGSRTEFPRIQQEDVDAAVADLTERLGAAWTDRLDDPDLGGGTATVFADTATLGDPTFSTDLDALVGQEVESFELGANAHGTVTAVDASPVETIAEERLGSSVKAGYRLVDGSSDISVDPAVVADGTISFPVVVTARQVPTLDAAEIEAAILGKPLAEARSILDTFGEADLQVWPDWVGTVPTIDGRVEVTIDGPVVVETPEPSP